MWDIEFSISHSVKSNIFGSLKFISFKGFLCLNLDNSRRRIITTTNLESKYRYIIQFLETLGGNQYHFILKIYNFSYFSNNRI